MFYMKNLRPLLQNNLDLAIQALLNLKTSNTYGACMKKFLMSVALLSLSTHSMAALTEQQETYAMFCGSRADLKEFAQSKGQKITNKDILELSQSRAPLLNVLKKGKQGIKELLDEGNASDTGPFGVIIACGMIDQLKQEILAEGCYDLKTNKAVRDQGGIEACAEVMASLPK